MLLVVLGEGEGGGGAECVMITILILVHPTLMDGRRTTTTMTSIKIKQNHFVVTFAEKKKNEMRMNNKNNSVFLKKKIVF